jgi:L-ascorbate metabolism protein UlaG (beta-lactamase superfamily)
MTRAWGAGLVALAVIGLMGCPFRPGVRPPGDPDKGVRVLWMGHSCFTLTDSAGRVFLVDPFDDTVGYPTLKLKPDAVLVTHEHFDHDAVPKAPAPLAGRGNSSNTDKEEKASGSTENKSSPTGPSFPFPVVRSLGTQTAAGIEVFGILADHDDQGGRRNGTTRMYVWEMGGLRWAHLGDIGQRALRPDQKEALSGVDVLFIPVGGQTTVDAEAAAALVQEIQPRIVIPMHFGTSRTRFYEFDPVDPFLERFERVNVLPPGEFHIRRATLPAEITVFFPSPPVDQETR